MLSHAFTPIRSTICGAICAGLLIYSAGAVAAQPPPPNSGSKGQVQGPSGLPPELQKISEEYAKANKLYANKQFAEALVAYQNFVHLAIIEKLNSSAILAAYSNIAVIDHILGDTRGYAEVLQKIVDLDPKNAPALAQLALAESLEHHFDLAEQHANRALALGTSKNINSTAHFVKGNVAVDHKDFVAAAKEFAEAARLLPTNTMAHFNCGLALAEQKRYTEAQKELDAAHKLDPKNARVNEYLEKLKTYLASIKAQPAPPSGPATKYDATLKKDPHNGPALLGRARALAQMGRTNEAEAAYIQATLVTPDSFEAHFNVARLYLIDKEYVHAKDHYKIAQQIADKAGNTANAAKSFGGLADTELQEGMAERDYRVRAQAFSAAEISIKQAISTDPKEAEFKTLLGSIYEKQSKFTEAGNTYREMLVGSPNSLVIYARLANTYKAVRDIPGYVKVWKDYQARKPDDPNSYEYITEMYNQVGKYQDAIDTLRDMLKRNLTNSVNATARVILGQDLIELKHPDEARGEFNNVLAMAPSKVEAAYILTEKAALDTAQRAALRALAGEDAKENKFDEAIANLNELKKREAEVYRSADQLPDGEVYKNIATLYEQSKRTDKALAEYAQMAKVLPSDPTPHEEMGRLLDSLNKTDAAAAEYKLAAPLNTKDPIQDGLKISDMYQRNNMLDKAQAELEALRKANPTKVEVLTALAQIYRRTKQDEKALQIYDAIIKTNPSQGWVQDERAHCMINLHRYSDAEKVFVEEINRNPKAGRQSYADLGNVYGLEGKQNEFLGFMKSRYEKDPSNSVAMAVVYDEYMRQKKEAEGQAYITGIIEKSGPIRRNCLQAYAILLQVNKHKAESLEIYRRIAKDNSKDISAWISLADELDFNTLQDEANQIYVDQAARTDIQESDRFSLRYKLATRYYQQKKFPQARSAFQVMFNHNNKNFDVAMRLGDLIEKDSADEAISFYNSLLGIQTYIPQVQLDIRDRLGSLYEKVNKQQDAVKQFNEALRFDKDDAVANAHLKKLLANPASAPAQ